MRFEPDFTASRHRRLNVLIIIILMAVLLWALILLGLATLS
jgi:hypothetical protein